MGKSYMPYGPMKSFFRELNESNIATATKESNREETAILTAHKHALMRDIIGSYYAATRLPIIFSKEETKLGGHDYKTIGMNFNSIRDLAANIELFSGGENRDFKKKRASEEELTDLLKYSLSVETPILISGEMKALIREKESRVIWETRESRYSIEKRISNFKKNLKSYESKLNDLIRANLKFVAKMAGKYFCAGMDFADFVQEGSLGLKKGIEMFDVRRGYNLTTYAGWWIRQAINRAIMNKGHLIRIPVHNLPYLGKLGYLREKFILKFNCEPTPEELADGFFLNQIKKSRREYISVTRIKRLLPHLKGILSLESPVNSVDGGEEHALYSVIRDTKTDSPEEIVSKKDMNEKIRELLSTLDSRQAEIMDKLYGLTTGIPRTLSDVGEDYELSRERIRQLEAKALKRLRHPTKLRILTE